LRFEWDPEKAALNLAKHGVTFAEAELVWQDPLHAIYFDRIESGEVRWWVVGVVPPSTTLVVVHMHPDPDVEVVRIIGARKATRQERRRYEEDNA
jgi:uncharacterized DUF497 family protein